MEETDDVSKIRVLLAEDNPGDVFLVREALQSHGLDTLLTVQADGEDMMNHIERGERGEEPRPDVILLDLNLPRRSGEALLKQIRESRAWAGVPIIIVTSSDSPQDREITARLGANSYFRKPPDFDEFLKLGAVVKRFIKRDVM